MRTVILVVSAVILIITFLLFLGFYERFLLYYEEARADRIADIIGGVIFGLFLIFAIITGWRTSVKRNQLKVFSFIKEVIVTVGVMLVVHLIYIRSVLSGLILLINCNVGLPKEIEISGDVLNVWIQNGRAAQYEITVRTGENNELVLDTKKGQIESYSEGDIFKRRLFKGCLGLVYVK